MAPRFSTRPRAPHPFLALALVAGALAAFGCTSKIKTPVVSTVPTINIVPSAATKGMLAFSPDSIAVHVNDTVRMHNGDSILHDIEPLTPGDPGWGNVSAGQSVDTQATAIGTFTYVCAVPGHTMIGKLTVLP